MVDVTATATTGTQDNTVIQKIKAPNFDLENKKAQCRAKGGVWDDKTNSCIMPTQDQQIASTINLNQPTAPTTQNPTNPTIEQNTTPQVFQSADTGRASGITTTDGRVFLGLGPKDVQNITTGEQARTAIPQGTQTVADATAQRQELEMRLHQAAQVGQIDFATAQQMETAGIDWKQAILSGVSNVVPNAITLAGAGAGVGAAAGAIGGPTAAATAAGGAIVGGIAGAIKGFYQGVTNNIKKQKGDFISIKSADLGTRTANLKKYISATNANPSNSDEYLQAFNMELSLIQRDYNNLHKEAQRDLNKWNGEDGGPELAKYEIFFESTQPLLESRMKEAVLTPDLSKAYLTSEDLNVQ